MPVTYLDLSIEHPRLLNLALNKISGSWDERLLARLLTDLQTSREDDLTLSGFAEEEIRDLLRSLETREKKERVEEFDLDSALEDAARTQRSKPGDLWSLGEHRLLCGDATKPEDAERLLGGSQATMAFTDPPYNVSLGDHGGQQRGSRKRRIRQRLDEPDRPGSLRASLGTNPARQRRRCHLLLHEQQGDAACVSGSRRGRWSLVRHNHLAQGSLRPRSCRLPAGIRADLVRLARRLEPKEAERLVQLRDQLLPRVNELQAVREARTLVQEHYFDGHGALFPDVARTWDEQVRSSGDRGHGGPPGRDRRRCTRFGAGP